MNIETTLIATIEDEETNDYIELRSGDDAVIYLNDDSCLNVTIQQVNIDSFDVIDEDDDDRNILFEDIISIEEA